MPKLTKTVVEAALPRKKQFTLWCSDLPGFGAYVLPSGNRTYFVDYRNAAGVRRRLTLGRHGKLTAEEARKLAITAMGDVARGADPADQRNERKTAITVKELCEKYLIATEKGLIDGKRGRPKKQSTLYIDRGRIARHILPLLGAKPVRDLTPPDIHRFIREVADGKTAMRAATSSKRGLANVRGGRGTASRTAGLLGGILSFAVSEGVIAVNPARGVRRPADNHRTRRLSAEEYARLGKALEDAGRQAETPQVILGIWLLALTGCRSGEIVNLQWTEVDERDNCFRLQESKEGPSIRPVGSPVFHLLDAVPRQTGCKYVLYAVRGEGAFGGMPRGWKRIAERAGLVDVTPHTLRHSFASVAGDLGFAESTISALLGHAAGSVTSRYVHRLDSVLAGSADRVAHEILRMMKCEPAEVQVQQHGSKTEVRESRRSRARDRSISMNRVATGAGTLAAGMVSPRESRPSAAQQAKRSR